MNKEDIKTSFDNIEPSESEKQRMLHRILHSAKNKNKVQFSKSRYLKRAIQVFAMLLVVAGSIWTYHSFQNYRDKAMTDDMFNLTFGAGDENDMTNRPEGIIEEKENDAGGISGEIGKVMDAFVIENRHYTLLNEDVKKQLNFSDSVQEKDIGDKITTITKSLDETLKGCDVYTYLPAGCNAVVALKKNGDYLLFQFCMFEEYVNNQDKDALSYLDLYGIYRAEDILKIQIGNVIEITDKSEISTFYTHYSKLKNSSDEYFRYLRPYPSIDSGAPDKNNSAPDRNAGTDMPGEIPSEPQTGADGVASYNAERSQSAIEQEPDKAYDLTSSASASFPDIDETPPDLKNTSSGGVNSSGQSASSGCSGASGNALENSVTIQIYNKNGLYFNMQYYPNIGFISGYKITGAFADFLNKLLAS